MAIMKNPLEEFVHRRIKCPKDEDVREILDIFSMQTFDKGALFKKRDTIIKKLGFLSEGSARSFFINAKGDEITDEVFQKNNFLSDIISVRSNAESPIVIELLEKSEVLVAPMEKVWDLLSRNVTFNILIREYIGDRAMELVRRHLMFLNGTAKERYQYLLATNPSLLEKFPLRFIATLIGITHT
jgi:CRP-like cAMP-binding protein